MRKTWMPGATGAALAAVLATTGCYDFDAAQQRCLDEQRCEPEGGLDGGRDAGCIPAPSMDLPDDGFSDTDCDGMDGQADAGLFVDPADGDDVNGKGTRESPLRTLGRALELLRVDEGAGPAHLYLAGGAYNESGLVLDVPTSLHGGYTGLAGSWLREKNRPVRLDGGVVGLEVRNLPDAGVVLEYLRIRSADAVKPGEPSVALRVERASGVRLRHTLLWAGLGAEGFPGVDGAPGRNGADGGLGEDAGVDTVFPGLGGPGGKMTCSDGSAPHGGDGSTGGFDGGAGKDGGMGMPNTAGGIGGAARSTLASCTALACECAADSGTDGLGGADGGRGTPGTPGAGWGVLESGTWVANQHGGDGRVGLPGAGGGGGGSGGTCYGGTAYVSAGGGSGGGGSGGCGGAGGLGGGGGGASISLLLIDSQVGLETGIELRTRGGGAGGRGGSGGPGGPGGSGGAGGYRGYYRVPDGKTYVTEGGAGGNGGHGGSGGRGGAGGGGGGGPSVGVWCGPGSGMTRTDGGVTFNLGNGGAGGPSVDSPGANGGRADLVGCPPTP